jgi:hypothetical protein
MCWGKSGLELLATLRRNGHTFAMIRLSGRADARRAHQAHRRVAAQSLGVHALVQAKPRALRFWCCQTPSSIASYPRTRDLALPKPVREVIQASKPFASWRTLAGSLAHRVMGVSQGYSA